MGNQIIRFLIGFIFKSSFRFTPKLSRKYRLLPYTLSHTSTTSSTINIPQQSGTFVTMDEPTLTHYHLKSTVYIRDYYF